jgi:Mg-chelatase subunit ChlD
MKNRTASPIFGDFVDLMDVDSSPAAPAETALALKINPRHGTIGVAAAEPKTAEFCATISARSLPEDNESARAPVDLVVALDVSASMTGRNLELCKDTVELLLRELRSEDRFGLVTFGDDANLVIPTRKLTPANKESAASKVRSLCTRGCTNMSGGIGLAAEEINAVENPHEVRTIFLLTDGHANRGISDREGIVSLTKSCLGATENRNEVAIHCFGYGADHDSGMLRDVSKATEGGSYYFVEKDSDVSSAFGDALGGVLSVVAQNTSVIIKPASERVTILNVKHDKAIQESDGSYKIRIGDFYAEESRDIIFESTLRDPVSNEMASTNILDANIPHVNVFVSYLDTIQKKLTSSPSLTGFLTRPPGSQVSKVNTHVALQNIRVTTTKVISHTEILAKSNLANARSTIRDHIKKVQNEAYELEETTNPLIVQTLSELNSILAGLSSRSQYEKTGINSMAATSLSMANQRCYESNESRGNVYRNPAKSCYSRKMKKMSMK